MAQHTRSMLRGVAIVDEVRHLARADTLTGTGAFVITAWPRLFPAEPIPNALPRLAGLAETMVLVELSLLCSDEEVLSANYMLDLMTAVMRSSVHTLSSFRQTPRSSGLFALTSTMPPSPVGISLMAYCSTGNRATLLSRALSEFVSSTCAWLRGAAANGKLEPSDEVDRALRCMFRMLDRRIGEVGARTSYDAVQPGAHMHDSEGTAGSAWVFDEDFRSLLGVFQRCISDGAWDGVICRLLRPDKKGAGRSTPHFISGVAR
jgi:hypothetical protein